MIRSIFFDSVREPVFHGLSRAHVQGCEAILDEADRRGITNTRYVAYMLATAFWETARTMEPVREIGHGVGRAYGVPDPETLQAYYGRGLVQLTWKANYAVMAEICLVDLVRKPDLALDLDVAVKIMFEGMLRGSFTGHKLADYFSAEREDWIGARRIINGTDRAAEVAGFARQFDAALQAARLVTSGAGAFSPTPLPSPITLTPRPSLLVRLKQFIQGAPK